MSIRLSNVRSTLVKMDRTISALSSPGAEIPLIQTLRWAMEELIQEIEVVDRGVDEVEDRVLALERHQ